VLRNQGKYDEARQFHERALAVREKVYGEEHPSTANSLNNLGITLHEQGKHDEARRYYERALAIYEKIHGEEHPVTELLRQNLRILDDSQQRTRTGYWNKFFGNGHG
jgi:tetratricopeptide (TPR) repeat protein